MIALVTSHKGIGKICQYQVTYENGQQRHYFVSYGATGEDALRHKLAGSNLVLAHREDNNVRALITEHEGKSFKCIKKVWY